MQNNKNNKIVVIGGGAAGMMAAGTAAKMKNNNKNNNEDVFIGDVFIIEKNEKLGKKIYITGKGRCNLSNLRPPDEYLENIPGNPTFLYSAMYGFTANDTVDLFNSLGLKTKVERGLRVFPESDKSSDVINALKKYMTDNNVKIMLNTSVSDILAKNGRVVGVKLKDNTTISANKVIVATGGLSYPATGSNGDGYSFAKKLGHSITELRPSLVSLKVKETFKELQGLSLKNVKITAFLGKKAVYKDFGEMLFTHDGISGPLILSASRMLTGKIGRDCVVSLDLKPALTMDELDKRILKDFENLSNKNFCNALDGLLPQKLIPVIVKLSEIEPSKKVNSITKSERKNLVYLLKNLNFTITGTGGFNEAIITVGGVSVNEINPATMESKIIEGLYFAGEVIDVDGFTGGFNLQIAFSTGYLAGKNASEKDFCY